MFHRIGLNDTEGAGRDSPQASRRDAVHLAAGAVHEGVDAVFALSGDGTANEVLQGLAGSDTALGLLPMVTASMLAAGAMLSVGVPPVRTIHAQKRPPGAPGRR